MYESDGYEHYWIRLRDNETHDIADVNYRYPAGYDEEVIQFYWQDGNGACDCNRMLEFRRVKGADLNEHRFCGSSRMALLGVWRARDGEMIVPSEDEDVPENEP
jgi:hypothetical protein